MAGGMRTGELAGLDAATDPAVLLNQIERLASRVQALEDELGRARDEINRLKGEQGRPQGQQKKRQRLDRSSERERREQPKAWHKHAKLPEIVIDREVECRLDPAALPADARLKDHVEVTVQDVVLRTDNVRLRCERWAAASTGRTYRAPLPPGYDGEFGPGLKALALTLSYSANVGQAQIRRLVASVGVQVSAGYLAGLLTDTADVAPEAQAVGVAGLACDGYAHIDVTPKRVAGVEQQCHVLGNTAFVYYYTDQCRDRQAAMRTLQRLSAGLTAHNDADGPAELMGGDLARARLDSQTKQAGINQVLGVAQTGDAALSQITSLLNKAHDLWVLASEIRSLEPALRTPGAMRTRRRSSGAQGCRANLTCRSHRVSDATPHSCPSPLRGACILGSPHAAVGLQ